jgi:hypothetical protein
LIWGEDLYLLGGALLPIATYRIPLDVADREITPLLKLAPRSTEGDEEYVNPFEEFGMDIPNEPHTRRYKNRKKD